jgi:hypothetical protein
VPLTTEFNVERRMMADLFLFAIVECDKKEEERR